VTADESRIYARDGRLLALARYDARRHAYQPWKVLALAGPQDVCKTPLHSRVSTAEPSP
jgi:hypothetical protein